MDHWLRLDYVLCSSLEYLPQQTRCGSSDSCNDSRILLSVGGLVSVTDTNLTVNHECLMYMHVRLACWPRECSTA